MVSTYLTILDIQMAVIFEEKKGVVRDDPGIVNHETGDSWMTIFPCCVRSAVLGVAVEYYHADTADPNLIGFRNFTCLKKNPSAGSQDLR